MTTGRKKIRLIVLSTMHTLLDKVIDLNSVEAVKQYIRDLENGIDDLQESLAIARGDYKGAIRRVENLAGRIEEKDQNINYILTDGDSSNDHLAIPMEASLTDMKAELQTIQQEVTDDDAVVKSMEATLDAVNDQHTAMLSNLSRIEAMDRMTRGKEQAAEALKGVSSLTGGAPSVDDIVAKMQARADVADARLEAQTGSLQSNIGHDEVRDALAARALEQRKARLGLPANTGTTPALPAQAEPAEQKA